MRAPPLRPLAVLALSGALLGGTLAGCGKGAASQTTARAGGAVLVPAARGVVGISTKNTTRLGGADPVSDAAAVAQAVYPGFTPATRPQAVVLVNEHNWPAALASSSLAAAPLGAPILYADGNSLPAASAEALHAMRPIGAASLGGAQVIRIGTTAEVPGHYVTRTIPAGGGPAAAAGAVEGLFDAAHGGAPRQVIVLAAEAPRALQMPAASLSAESGSPILFVDGAGVPPPTAVALHSLHRPHIYVAGPTALSIGAYSALGRFGPVIHVAEAAGAGDAQAAGESVDPIENAISVSRFAHGSFGWGVREAGHGLAFVNASRPLDAPAAAPLAAHGDYAPLLLLADAASVPPSLAHYLSDIEPGYTTAVAPVREVYNHGWLIGDEQAITALAQAEIDTVLEIAPRKPSAAEQSVATAE